MTAGSPEVSPRLAAPTAPIESSARHRLPLVGALVVNLFVAALCGFLLWHSRLAVLADTQGRVVNLARMAELNVSSTLDKAGIALTTTALQLERQLTARGVDARVLWDIVDAETTQVPEILRIGVFDAQGHQVCTSEQGRCLHLDVSDRDYFQQLKADPAGGVRLFGPAQNRVDGQSSLIMARALRRADGSFVGVAAAIIPVRGLQALMAAVDVGASGRAGLRDENLALLAEPPGPRAPAEDLARLSKVSPELLSAVKANPSEGAYRAPSGFDAVDRQAAYRRLPKYPLYVLVGIATADSLAPWRQTAGWTAGFLLLFAVTSWVVVRLVQSGMRRQAKVRALLAQVTESEDRLRRLYETTPAMLHAIDLDGRLIVVSDAWLAKLGYARPDVLGRRSVEFLTEASRQFVQAEGLPTLMRTGRQDDLELQMLTRAGEVIDVLLSARLERADDGTPLRIVAGLQDVTARRRAERALDEERQRLENIVQGTGAGTWHHTLGTGEDSVNANYAAMLGYTQEELRRAAGVAFIDLVHPADRAGVAYALQAHLDGATPAYQAEFRMRHRDGRWIWVFSRGSVFLRDDQGRPAAITGIHLDITERKLSEQAHRDSSERFELAAESASIGVWEFDLATGQVQWDDRMFRLYGSARREGAQARDIWFERVHAQDLPGVQAALERTIKNGRSAAEFRIVWPGGEVRHLSGHAQAVRDPEGRTVRVIGVNFDITDRRNSEDRLRASKAFLDSAGRVAGVGGWMLQLATGDIEWTDETCRIHDVPAGHKPTIDEAIGYYAPEARLKIQAAVECAVAHGESWDLELPLVTAQGRSIWVRAIGEVEAEDGKAVRLVGAFQDVTARRALEDELRDKNEMMSSILENLPCGLSVFDRDLRLVASNTEYRRLLDFPDELFETPVPRFEDFIRYNARRGEYGGGELEDTVRTIVDRARLPAVPHRFERVRPNGVPVEVQGAPMPTGGFVTTYTDISERKRAELALQQRERLMRLVIDSFPGPLAHWDTEMRCTIANRAYREWMGLDPEQMLGRTQRELLSAEQYANNEPHILAALRGEEQRVERTRVIANGSMRHYFLHYLPDRDGEHVRGFISVVVDVSEMKQVQLQLQERTAQAEQANVAKGRFLANMSHEIRTPMNAILGMLKLLCNTPLSVRQLDYARKTERAARALLGLLNDILDFSKIEAGKMALDPRAFSLDEILGDLSVILASNLGDKPVEVLFDVDPALPPRLVGDDMRLQQVLVNLAGNAIKFTARGEVVVQVQLIENRAGRCRLRFAVRDTGIGIAPDQLQQVFRSFSQAEASTTRRFGGTGLGLSICQRLVGLMGGHIEVRSEPGVGSTFQFELELPVAATSAGVEHETLRALIVDDNPTARIALAGMTASLGWAADVAASGDEAISMLEHQLVRGTPYQAVFVDWQMPGMDGWQTSARLREIAGPDAPPLLLMVTANGREKLAQRPPQEQALLNGFLVKPVTASMLREAVAEARDGGAAAARTMNPMRLSGLRLLVVEDNTNNQQVAQELLEGEGALVRIACDGEQGVAAVAAANPPFDAVLMDVQMPVMDGYTATTEIRQRLGLAMLPIIAMTANAMSSDRDASLAAGMNDHVGKPFDLDELVATLLRHTGSRQLPAPSRAAPALPAELLDEARSRGIELQAAVARFGGRADVWTRTARSFAGQIEGMAQDLAGLLDRGDRAEAGRLMHTLKGLASMLGATDLAAFASDAEQALRGTPSPEALAALRAGAAMRIGRTSRDFQALLQRQRSATPAPTPVARDKQALLRELGALAGLLAGADMAATDRFAALQDAHEAHWAEELQALSEAVSALDFERALVECRKLTRMLVAA